MRRRITSKLLATAGLAGLLAFSASAGFAKESGTEAGGGTETVTITSFSGAFLAARAAEADNDLASAIDFYKRALGYQPDNQTIRQSLLLTLIAEGRFDESLPYAESLKAVPEVERFSRLGLAVDALRKEKYVDAEGWLQLVLESDLDKLITVAMTSWAKVGQGEPDEALDDLDTLEGPDWYSLFLNYHRGLIAIQKDDDARVRDAFDAIITVPGAASAAPDTYMRAAEVYAAWLAGQGEKDEALETLDDAEKFITGRAATLMLREKINAGEKVEMPVSGVREGAAEILLNIATALNRGGGEPFVKLYLNYALALNPDSDDTVIQLASVAEQQGEPEKAIELYKRIKPGSPWRRLAELQTGLNLADLDRHTEAASFLDEAIKKEPDDMRAYLALGRVYAVQKDFASAAKVYDRAAEKLKDPQREDYQVFYQRGIAYERLKEWDKAEPNFHKALELYPDQPQVLNYLGYSWVDMDMNLKEGMELIRRAVELRPNDGYIVDSLGWAYYRLGNYEEASRELERAVSLRPEDPVLNDHLGDAYWRTGRKLEATFQWSHARDLDPEPDLLAEVETKLKEGLPDEEPRKIAEAGVTPEVKNDASNGAPQAQPEAPDPAAVPAKPETQAEPEPEAVPAEAAPAPKEEPAPAPAQPEDKSEASAPGDMQDAYVVKRGDTLWSIAAEQLGDGERFREILSLNPALKRNPDLLRSGMEIRLPR
ncbi:tetratricopeptide repeat protein [Nitratireductor indicus]|uniref:tetratricopeptide repeat protein n=1 Tax=Nitratireductor indicus TaxID=721133 RepID=UPI002873F758|nr:tetratricopeptide repeat protein [Nitratireductor indicus]MDS1138471.1 tetratricopeptide repeat protein [Nitratireductor indicus]